MRAIRFVVVIALAGCSQPVASPAASNNPQREVPAASKSSVTDLPVPPRADATGKSVKAESAAVAEIKPLTTEELQKLFDTRLDSTMCQMMAQSADQPFGQFANMFLAFSTMTVGRGVGLMTSEQEVSKRPVSSPYPSSYRPRLREILDSLALQTFTKWSYDPSSKYLDSNINHGGPVNNLAMFEFVPTKRELPYELVLAKGWKAVEKGNWVMYVPPSFIVGMDIHNMGRYSTDVVDDGEFLASIPREVSLEWARRVGQMVAADRLSDAKVGPYDAVFFETVLDTKDGQKLHWRQWAFMVDDVCYAVISTIFAPLDATIFADIEEMLPTFKMKKNEAARVNHQ